MKTNKQAYFKVDYKTREENNKKIIEGYFIVYNQKTELWANFFEQISKGACTKSIISNDIRALYNHDSNIVLGRNKSGTLQLMEDEYGVKGVIEINQNDSEALNIYERVKRGDISGCSFGFWPDKESYEYGDDSTTVTVEEADILEISVCPFPAYPQTQIQARQADFQNEKQKSIEHKKALVKERFNNGFKYYKAPGTQEG
jgi:HK97 family phage prohead protease